MDIAYSIGAIDATLRLSDSGWLDRTRFVDINAANDMEEQPWCRRAQRSASS